MAQLSIRLLGPLEVTLDGKPVSGFASDKVRALLAYLAVEGAHAHRRQSLAGLLWADWPERSARDNLRHALSNLRAAIGDRTAEPPTLLVTRETIRFNPGGDHELDVAGFESLAAGESAEGWAEAMDLYQGPFLEGFSVADSAPFEEWARVERQQLQRQAIELLGRLAWHWEKEGDLERALGYARRQVELAPWEEGGHRQVMRTLALCGQRGAALAQYEACRRALDAELGVEPAAETVRLYERVRDGELRAIPTEAEEGLATVGAPSPSVLPRAMPRHNLPARLTPLFGREGELAEIAARLSDPDCRLLTLVGPGGSGKTRLAVEAAARATRRYAHGVAFVPLAPLRSPEGIVPAMAQALGFSFHSPAEGGPPTPPKQQLLDYLRGRGMLLVLDNYEHLLEGADLVIEVLRAAPQVIVLVTSRASLNLPGERLFPVGSLGFAGARRGHAHRVAGDRCRRIGCYPTLSLRCAAGVA